MGSRVDRLLVANAAKPAREQLTLIRMFEEFRGRGYDGGYDAVHGSGNVGRFTDLGGAWNEDPGPHILEAWCFARVRIGRWQFCPFRDAGLT